MGCCGNKGLDWGGGVGRGDELLRRVSFLLVTVYGEKQKLQRSDMS